MRTIVKKFDKGPVPSRFAGDVRLLKESDIEVVRIILETWIRNSQTREIIHEEVSEVLSNMAKSVRHENKKTYFVAEEHNQAIGIMGVVLPEADILAFGQTDQPIELVNAFVAKDHHGGRGVGRALVARIEEEMHHLGYTEMILSSGPRYKESGWGFYDAIGFVRCGVIKDYFGSGFHAQIWRKTLE